MRHGRDKRFHWATGTCPSQPACLPDFPLPLGALLPLRAHAEELGVCDFTPLWAGEMAARTQEMPAKALTLRFRRQAITRLKQLDGRSE
jgi:hypothetical protein